MAKIGLKYPVYKTSAETPANGVIGKAIQASISITLSDVKLYGDDAMAENEKAFQSGTISLNTTDLSFKNQADLLGHTYDDAESTLVANSNDVAPYTGVGFYGVLKVNNVRKFRAVWLPKVLFGEPNDEMNTKGESVEFGTYTMEGNIMQEDDGKWKEEALFETAEEAVAYLDEKKAIATP